MDQNIQIVDKLNLRPFTLKKLKHLKPPKNLGANNSIAASQIQNIETSCVHLSAVKTSVSFFWVKLNQIAFGLVLVFKN